MFGEWYIEPMFNLRDVNSEWDHRVDFDAVLGSFA